MYNIFIQKQIKITQMYNFNNIFIQIRKNQDLTQTEFAQKLGVSRSLVAKIEANQQEISKNVYKKLLEKYPDEMKKYNLIDKNYTFDFVSLQELNTRLANVNMVLDDNIKLLHLLCSILYKNNYKFTEKRYKIIFIRRKDLS